ncbi:hypothetical protein BDU57DRAFT_175196 [Ampelomyces quisqualis]|uniref:Uncharacterized protein n=1 Tax=Ampelomyces quisqualis TaxID=50730 RepID=A0A6A5QPX9_AMPQU|nr:hypothetical protein BDU57DRAFT_175196 [Ampelomyces quisqualis]
MASSFVTTSRAVDMVFRYSSFRSRLTWFAAEVQIEEASEALAIPHDSRENLQNPTVQLWHNKIVNTIHFERERESSSWVVPVHPSNRKRTLIVATIPLIFRLPGTKIGAFYFGDMLSSAGINNANTRLQINVILTSRTLVLALARFSFAPKIGRKLIRRTTE